jgi:hypothetical protein
MSLEIFPLLKKLRYILEVVLLLTMVSSCTGAPRTPETAIPSIPPTGLSPTSDKYRTGTPTSEATSTEDALLETPGTIPTPISPAYPVPGIELNVIDSHAFDLTKQAGAYWIRRNGLIWSEVEPQEGARNWDALADLEKELLDAAEKGLQVVLVVQSTPTWAQKSSGYFCGAVSQDKFLAFARFLQDAVSRYSVPPYNVRYWELGNEPDIDPSLVPSNSMFGCWGDEKDPYYGGGYYAEMLKQVYPHVKSVDLQAHVMVGGLVLDCDPVNPPGGKDCTPSLFLEGILRNGGGEYFDGVSFHAYDYYLGPSRFGNPNWQASWNVTGPVLIPKIRFLRSVLVAHGYSEKFLMNTESGLVCGRDGLEPLCQDEDFNQTKASYVAQVNIASLAEDLRANIWYSLTGWRGSGLVDANMKPYPAYEAYRFSASQLLDSAFVRKVNDFEGILGYELSRDGKHTWILWTLYGKKTKVHLPFMPTAIYDIFGKQMPVSQDGVVTNSPLYIEWTP